MKSIPLIQVFFSSCCLLSKLTVISSKLMNNAVIPSIPQPFQFDIDPRTNIDLVPEYDLLIILTPPCSVVQSDPVFEFEMERKGTKNAQTIPP